MLWIEVGLYAVAGLAFVIFAVRNTREWTRGGGKASDLYRPSTAVVEVAVGAVAAGDLCKRALLEVNETRTSRSFRDDKLRVRSHLDVKDPGALSVGFGLEPVAGERTRIVVSLYPRRGVFDVRLTRQRRALAERLAAEGGGRIVALG